MRINNFILILAILVTCCVQEKEQRGVSYHENGKLKHEVPLKNGAPDGLGIVYYENGKIHSKTHWKDGIKHGKNVLYFENGHVEQENEYIHGVRCCISKDFTFDGRLRQLTKLDSRGRILDYELYNKDGERDFSDGTKRAIFIVDQDTVKVGDYFSAYIRLGNRQLKVVEVYIGKLERDIIKKINLYQKKIALQQF